MLSRLKSKHPYLFTLSFMEFIGYGTSIAALGYLTVFLQEVGLDAAQVGMVTAINSVVGMVASPFWGIVSDKMQSMRKTLLICMSVAMVLWFFVPASSQWFLWGMPVMSILLPVTNFFRAPMSSLVDSWTVRSANEHRLNFNTMRMFGTIGYSATGVFLSWLTAKFGVNWAFYVHTMMLAAAIIVCLMMKNEDRRGAEAKAEQISLRDMHFGKLFKNYSLVTYFIYLVLYCIPLNSGDTFLPYLMEEIGITPKLVGIIMAVRSAMEIPILLGFHKFRAKFSLPTLLTFQCACYMMIYFSLTVIKSKILFILVMCIQGMSSGIEIGCANNYVYALAPDELKSTAVMLGNAMWALSGFLANFVGGYIVQYSGIRTYYIAMGIIGLVTTLFFAASFPIGRKHFGVQLPESVGKTGRR